MTVSSETKRAQYDGNDATVEFSIPFYFFADSDIDVYLDDTLKTLTTHYTVADEGEPSGGTLTMLTAPATGETLTIIRDVALTQGVDYVENSSFPADSHETALDRLTMISQQLQEEVNRALVVNPSDPDGLNYEIPGVDDRAEKYLYFDADGNLSVSSIFYATVTSDYWAAIVDDETLAASLTSMGLSTPVQASLNLAGDAQAMYYAGTKKLETVTGGVTVTGDLTASNDIIATSAVITNLIETVAGKTGATFIEDGSVELYYAGTKRLETAASGLVTIYDSDASDSMSIGHDGSVAYILNNTNGGNIQLAATNTGGNGKICLQGDPDGAAELYHAGIKRLETYQHGVSMNAGTFQFFIQSGASDFGLSGNIDGAFFQVTNTNNASASKVLIKADPDGAAELYYAGTKQFETIQYGVQAVNGANTAKMWYSGGGSSATLTTDTSWVIQVNTNENAIICDANGAVSLYYDGAKHFATSAEGVQLTGSFYIRERGAAQVDVSPYGQLWVKDATPNELWFTDDAGGNHQVAYV